MKICSIIRSGEDAPVLVAVERQRSEDEFAGTVRKNLDGDFWWFSSEAAQNQLTRENRKITFLYICI